MRLEASKKGTELFLRVSSYRHVYATTVGQHKHRVAGNAGNGTPYPGLQLRFSSGLMPTASSLIFKRPEPLECQIIFGIHKKIDVCQFSRQVED
jgi:hypothetical protein